MTGHKLYENHRALLCDVWGQLIKSDLSGFQWKEQCLL